MNKLVVHTAVGRIVKGQATDFSPMKDSFHLQSIDPPGKTMEVFLTNLKAIFFVKDFYGNPAYEEKKDFSNAPSYGKRVKIIFQDGEVFYGISDAIHRNRVGFFIFPADPDANTIRAFVLNDSIAMIEEA
jgi:hypothetical protein